MVACGTVMFSGPCRSPPTRGRSRSLRGRRPTTLPMCRRRSAVPGWRCTPAMFWSATGTAWWCFPGRSQRRSPTPLSRRSRWRHTSVPGSRVGSRCGGSIRPAMKRRRSTRPGGRRRTPTVKHGTIEEIFQMGTTRQHVVVIGGGFGGLNVSPTGGGDNVDVTIVDRTNHHLFQPLLYQVATGILPEGLIAPPIRRVVQSLPNVKVILAEVQDIDLDRKVAIAKTPSQSTLELEYDFLVVAAGSTHSYFGKDEFAEFAPGMKTVDDARYQRDAILSKFEMAETATDPQERAEWLTFVVIGAGPTGVEVAGQIAELAHQVLPKDYSKVDTRGARILLLEGAPAVLPPFNPKLQQYTKNALEKLGVEIRVSTLAVDMDHESVTVKGPNGVETIRARSRIWAAGVQASPLAKML